MKEKKLGAARKIVVTLVRGKMTPFTKVKKKKSCCQLPGMCGYLELKLIKIPLPNPTSQLQLVATLLAGANISIRAVSCTVYWTALD